MLVVPGLYSCTGALINFCGSQINSNIYNTNYMYIYWLLPGITLDTECNIVEHTLQP